MRYSSQVEANTDAIELKPFIEVVNVIKRGASGKARSRPPIATKPPLPKLEQPPEQSQQHPNSKDLPSLNHQQLSKSKNTPLD